MPAASACSRIDARPPRHGTNHQDRCQGPARQCSPRPVDSSVPGDAPAGAGPVARIARRITRPIERRFLRPRVGPGRLRPQRAALPAVWRHHRRSPSGARPVAVLVPGVPGAPRPTPGADRCRSTADGSAPCSGEVPRRVALAAQRHGSNRSSRLTRPLHELCRSRHAQHVDSDKDQRAVVGRASITVSQPASSWVG